MQLQINYTNLKAKILKLNMYSPASWYSTSYYKKSNNYLTTFMVQTLAMAFGILKSLASSSSGAQAEPTSCHQSDHRHSLQMEKVQRCSSACITAGDTAGDSCGRLAAQLAWGGSAMPLHLGTAGTL